MRKFYVLIVTLLISATSFAQYYWDYGVMVGATNYLGEMGGYDQPRRDWILDMRIDQTRFAAGGFLRYKINPTVSAKTTLFYNRITGADSLSEYGPRVARNLHFRNDLLEFSAIAELYFYRINDVGRTGRYRTDFQMYFYGGLGGLYHNPKAQYNGEWVDLRPLKTEGQAEPYNKFAFQIPAGVGLYYTFDRKYRLGFEIGWRTTFTDYLDDASTTYASPADLDSDLARELANRNDELSYAEGVYPDPRNYQEGGLRGEEENNDSYLVSTINFSYVIRGRSNFYRRKKNFIFGRRNKRRRKARAKF